MRAQTRRAFSESRALSESSLSQTTRRGIMCEKNLHGREWLCHGGTGKIGYATGGLGMGGRPSRAAIRNFAAMAGTACRAPTNSELRGGLHNEPGPGPNPRENQMRANVKAASVRPKFIAAGARFKFIARRTRLHLFAAFALTCAALSLGSAYARRAAGCRTRHRAIRRANAEAIHGADGRACATEQHACRGAAGARAAR